MEPLVSVIIPTHNRRERVRQAVLSALNQTYAPLEVVVVDDGSGDGTAAMLKDMGEAHLIVIVQKNRGVAAARNTGIGAAQGEYLAFLDSDDVWLSEKTDVQLRFMRDGGWRAAQSDEVWVRHGRRVNPARRHIKQAGWIFKPSLELCLVSPSCTMVHRSFVDTVGQFDESLPACEDYDLWLRASLKMPFGFLPRELVIRHGGHRDQLSSRFVGMDLYRIRALAKLLQYESLTREQRRLALSTLQEKADRYVQGCQKRGRMTEAGRILGLVQEVERSIP